mmetsp:Transcript_54493/g.129917  ORF Transcript_54493/g.129917 Transcript_54493/m.129917 type:complete len:166 (+) Transcript_54493:122-619(+)
MQYNKEEIKLKFEELDKNGDGCLSFEELATLLRRGRHDMSDDEVRVLWSAIDHDKDGIIDFDEFVDFLFSPYSNGKIDWVSMKKIFSNFSKGGELLDGTNWVRLCRQYELFDKDFELKDADIDYKKVANGHSAGIDFKSFKKLMKMMARRKCCPISSIVAWMVAT